METYRYRIYGDNIIECLRIIKMFDDNKIIKFEKKLEFINQLSLLVKYTNADYNLEIQLVPGFDKSNKKRWKTNILDEYKKLGSSLDETADAFITEITTGNNERILTIIEFCSALQAGNQAWQRSGRAYSCGLTKIPYFYVIDLPKYELDPNTRERKSLRYPNPVVAFSYLSYTQSIASPVLQIITSSEEYDNTKEYFGNTPASDIFNDYELENYIALTLLHKNTDEQIDKIKQKNLNLVKALSNVMSIDFTQKDIEKINTTDVANSILKHTKIPFKKTIAKKSATGNILPLNEVVSGYSIGVFKTDLPFGIIPKGNIHAFINSISNLYKFDSEIKEELLSKEYIVVTLMKGFKPGGDDNRPDRGILPLLRMLFGESSTILTIIYGPIVKSNYTLLESNKSKLAQSNGLWQTYINMSDFLLFDCPILGDSTNKNGLFKMLHSEQTSMEVNATFKSLDLTPVGFREDEVDTLFHILFDYFVPFSFCGMCNPPGGDWSGISLIKNDTIYRWLSLPRVSDDKRPDHVIQLKYNQEDYLFVMESKDKPYDLEHGIGPRLSNYIKWLCDFTPNVEQKNNNWTLSTSFIDYSSYKVITSGSFISYSDIDYSELIALCQCDIIFSCIPIGKKWNIHIFHSNDKNIMGFVDYLINHFSYADIVNKIWSTSAKLPIQIK